MKQMLNIPGRIGNLQLKNHVVMPAMGVNLGASGGGVSDDLIAYYEARAKGGVGLIISEITRVVDGAGAGEPCQLAARGAADIPDLQRLVDAVHKYGTKLFIQLQHPGQMASPMVTGAQPVAPSAPPEGPEGAVRALETAECEELVRAFITGAYIAKAAGADGVELHGAHGYLINSFLSPAMNRRTDQYGGSFENRMRFAVEILEGIRAMCGAQFPVSVRINAEEAAPGGIDLAEAQRIAAALEAAGADVLNVSCLSAGCIEPGTYEQGWKKYMASAVKQVVDIPVIAVCNIKEPAAAEQLLQEGTCDFVAVGRGHLADPDWCAKAFAGRDAEIRNCIGCLACFGEICKLHRIKCAVNPVTGREREYANLQKDGAGRPVAVVGGGPAGIEAALVLKARGFAPVIFDDGPRLGGALNVADKGYGKAFITRYTNALIAQEQKAGIEVRCGTAATVETVGAISPCAVFVACGAAPFRPRVEGIDRERVCTAEDVLTGKAKPEGKVVVIGSGMTGLETGELLADCGCDLMLADMLDEVGPGMYPTVVEDVMGRIGQHGPQVFTGHKLVKIGPQTVTLTRLADGETVELPANWVVLAMGVQPRREVVEAFQNAFETVVAVGDAVQGGRILEATQDAHAKAFVFDPN